MKRVREKWEGINWRVNTEQEEEKKGKWYMKRP